MIVDVSHANEKSFWDIMNIATKPVIASHSKRKKLYQIIEEILLIIRLKRLLKVAV